MLRCVPVTQIHHGTTKTWFSQSEHAGPQSPFQVRPPVILAGNRRRDLSHEPSATGRSNVPEGASLLENTERGVAEPDKRRQGTPGTVTANARHGMRRLEGNRLGCLHASVMFTMHGGP